EATHPAPPASLPDQVPPLESSRNLPAGLLTRIPERMYTIRRPRRPCVRRHGAARTSGAARVRSLTTRRIHQPSPPWRFVRSFPALSSAAPAAFCATAAHTPLGTSTLKPEGWNYLR